MPPKKENIPRGAEKISQNRSRSFSIDEKQYKKLNVTQKKQYLASLLVVIKENKVKTLDQIKNVYSLIWELGSSRNFSHRKRKFNSFKNRGLIPKTNKEFKGVFSQNILLIKVSIQERSKTFQKEKARSLREKISQAVDQDLPKKTVEKKKSGSLDKKGIKRIKRGIKKLSAYFRWVFKMKGAKKRFNWMKKKLEGFMNENLDKLDQCQKATVRQMHTDIGIKLAVSYLYKGGKVNDRRINKRNDILRALKALEGVNSSYISLLLMSKNSKTRKYVKERSISAYVYFRDVARNNLSEALITRCLSKENDKGGRVFTPKRGSILYTRSLSDLYPNENNTMAITFAKNRGKSKGRKQGETILIKRKGTNYYPIDNIKNGKNRISIKTGDIIYAANSAYFEKEEDNNDSRLVPVTIKGPKRIVKPDSYEAVDKIPRKLTEKEQRMKVSFRKNILNKTLRSIRVVKLPNIKPSTQANTHIPTRKALIQSGEDFQLDTNECSQFAFRMLSKVVGSKTLEKYGAIYADAWTMLHRMRQKETEDRVQKGTYAKVVDGVNLDKYYYRPGSSRIRITPKILYSAEYQNKYVEIFQAAKKVINRNGIAYITFLFLDSPNQKKATKKVRAGKGTPNTHIEALFGKAYTMYMKPKDYEKTAKNYKRKGNYFNFMVDAYVKKYMLHENEELPNGIKPHKKNLSRLKKLAITRLSMLYKTNTELFILDKEGGMKTRVMLVPKGNSFELRYAEKDRNGGIKAGNPVLFDPGNIKYFGFNDIHSRTYTGKNSFINNYLFFSYGQSILAMDALPSRVIQIDDLKWGKNGNNANQKINSLIKTYSSLAKENEDEDKDKDYIYSFSDLCKNYKIKKSDRVYYYEGLRRVGIDPSRMKENSPIPIFDMEKLKKMINEEGKKLKDKGVGKKIANLNKELKSKKISPNRRIIIKRKIEKLKRELVRPPNNKDGLALIYLSYQKQFIESQKKLYSNEGLTDLDKKIAATEALIERIEKRLGFYMNTRVLKTREDRQKAKEGLAAIKKYKKIIEARLKKYQNGKKGLEDILKNSYVKVLEGGSPWTVIKKIIDKEPFFKDTTLTSAEKKFIIRNIDRINETINLEKKNGKYVKWGVGSVIVISKDVPQKLKKIIISKRTHELANSTPIFSLKVGKRKGEIIRKNVSNALRKAISLAAGPDREIEKLLYLVYAREQGRSTKKRELMKWAAQTVKDSWASSVGVFQIKTESFKKGNRFKKFGVSSYKEFRNKVQKDVGFCAEVAAEKLKMVRLGIQEQLRQMGLSHIRRDHPTVYQTMVLSAYNLGPNVAVRSVMVYRFKKYANLLRKNDKFNMTEKIDLGYIETKNIIYKYGKKESYAKYMFKRKTPLIKYRKAHPYLRKGFSVYIVSPKVKSAIKLYNFASNLKLSYSEKFRFNMNEIDREISLYMKSPMRFYKTSKLYAAIEELVKEKLGKDHPNIDKIMFDFKTMKKAGWVKSLNYGYMVMRDGQSEEINNKIVDGSFLLDKRVSRKAMLALNTNLK